MGRRELHGLHEQAGGQSGSESYGIGAVLGFQALAQYDDPARGGDGDGRISPRDGIWGTLRLWVDRNHDGMMSRDEEYSLAAQGVVDISLAHRRPGPAEAFGVDPAGNIHGLLGTYRQRVNGTLVERALHDVWFWAWVQR